MQACTPHAQRHTLPVPPSAILQPLAHFLTLHLSPSITSLILYSMHLFASSPFVSLSVSVSNSLSTSSKTYCFSAFHSLLFLRSTLLSFLSARSFPPSPRRYTFSIIPYAGCPTTSSFSLISPLHSAVTFICSFIAFFFCPSSA